MDSNLDREIVLQDVLAFHEHLRRLNEAGVPLEVDSSDAHQPLDEILDAIASRLAMESGRGKPIARSLVEDSEIPLQYRVALESWFHCDRPAEALEALHGSAAERTRLQSDLSYSLFRPLVVLGFAYCGLLFLMLYTTPKLEAIYEQIHVPLSSSLVVLKAIKQWLPVWAPLLPLLIVLLAIWFRWQSPRWQYGWMPGAQQLMLGLRKASYAENLACLVDADYPIDSALKLVGPAPTKSVEDRRSGKLPPLIGWALTCPVENNQRAALLRSIADGYRKMANKQSEQLAIWLPVFIGSLLGGLLVLGYCLSLFYPLVQALDTLTSP